jgi:hypothetical protein
MVEQGWAAVLVWPFLQSGRSATVVGRNDGMWYGTGVIEVICV